MAINRTPDKYKGFTFDGVDSKDFGVYISDTGACLPMRSHTAPAML